MQQNGEMTATILVPWALTDWQSCGRYATRTPVPLNDKGQDQIAEWARIMAEHEPVTIYALDKDPADQTAQMLAKTLKIKSKKSAALEEVALGLWEGLTPDQLKQRFAKVYKQWKDDPASVCPPQGEALAEAVDRLITEIRRIARRHKGLCVAVVLGPLGFAGVRCFLEEKALAGLWEVPLDKPVKYWMNLEQNKAFLTS